ncbi:heat shock protein 68-like [Glossina fuscipes]|uniref:Heat shock protein 68-like n=1 Tax=Glossina fuscipes TaxID=7396 RepID=A0A9C5ZLJ0_9MUSC|nr:heat shock protein 68-like [Glossina fuscipes]KAI9576969.1 hypothetical protein GQX74_014336 [Glossina fuscipes]
MVAIGIDLGTTYSCVGVFQNGKVEIIADDQGNRTTPSYVAFTDTERLIGDAAKNQGAKNPRNTIYDIKRLIGRKYDDSQIQEDMKHWPFKVISEGGEAKIWVEFKGERKRFAPEEISSMILTTMKEIAEAYLGHTVKDAVVSVPAYFNDSQRQATKNAGAIADLNVLGIINEPISAVLAYGLDKNLKGERNVLIFDLGGGTFDVSILTIDQDSLFEVRATAGNTYLGGEDFDNRLVNHFVDEFRRKYHMDLKSNRRALRRLRTVAECAKRTLSSTTETPIKVDGLFAGIDFYTKVSRAQFEELCADLFCQTLIAVEKALNEAKMDKNEIDDIVLVGGSTRIPKVQNLLQQFFYGKKLNMSINPEEAVACGAAIQAAILNGNTNDNIQDVPLADASPPSLGMETADGVMTKIIERNNHILGQQYTLAGDQPAVTIQMFEDERAMTKENNLLGVVNLTGLPSGPRDIPKLNVTFDLDAKCILNVIAKETSSGILKKITINNDRNRLSQAEIDRMVRKAEHADEGENDRHRNEARNQLENGEINVKQTVKDTGEKVSSSDRSHLMSECNVTAKWLDKNMTTEKEEYEYHLKELSKICEPISPRAYQQTCSIQCNQ